MVKKHKNIPKGAPMIEKVQFLLRELSSTITSENCEVWLPQLQRFTQKQPCWVNQPQPIATDLLLRLFDTEITQPFSSLKDFVQREDARNSACFFNVNFTEMFNSVKVTGPLPGALQCHELKTELSDTDLITAIGGATVAETPFSTFLGALFVHISGDRSIFGQEDFTHIFYVKNGKEDLYAISVKSNKDAMLLVTSHRLRSSGKWDTGRRVLFPK